MRELFARLVDWFKRERLEQELAEELRFHRAQLERDARHEGAAPEDVPYAARRKLGSLTRAVESARERWSLPALEQFAQDVRYAWRGIRRTPGFSIMVVATLALGVGANAAMFGFLDRIFVQTPAGVESPATVRRLWTTRSDPAATYQGLNYPTYAALQREIPGVELALFTTDNTLRIGRDRASPPVHGVYATANYFRVLRLRPSLGRFFVADEDVMGAGVDVAVVSHHFWRTRLGGDSSILGKTVTLGKTRYTVIGVMQRDYTGVEIQSADIWIPLAAMMGSVRDGKPWYERTTTYGARAVMRVPPGFNQNEFGARATVIIRRVDQELRPDFADRLVTLEAGSIIAARGPGNWTQETTIATRIGGVTAIVLLIAVANVVNLLLARAMRRRREVAVRLALGVSRWRLARLLTTESLLLALLAAAAATLTAWWGGDTLRSLLMPDVEWIESAFDTRVALFTLALAIVAGLIAGIVPAVQASNPRLTSALKAGGQSSGVQHSRLRSGLVVVQSAFSIVLLVGAALFVRSLQNVSEIDIGFDVEGTMMAEVDFEEGESPGYAVIAAAMQDIARRLARHPGVEHLGRAYASPMRAYGVHPFFLAGDSAFRSFSTETGPLYSPVSHGFFDATGLRLLRGRRFSGSEYAPARNEVLVNQVAVRQLFRGVDPIGQCVFFEKRESACHAIVGVVEDANTMGVIEGKKSYFYVPLSSDTASPRPGTSIVVRVKPASFAPVANELRRELRARFPVGYPLVLSMGEVLEDDYRPWRLGATLFTAFGALALIVALIGIYSTVSYIVGQRAHEFGVRIALGAGTRDVLNQVLGEGMRMVGLGVAAGVLLALAAGRLVRSLLFGVESTDPSVMMLAACTLLVVAVAAGLVPAWRAARVDPVSSLKAE